jgi:hypothetical protein
VILALTGSERRVEYFSAIFFSIEVLFGVLFYLFFVLLVSGHYYLHTVNFGNL